MALQRFFPDPRYQDPFPDQCPSVPAPVQAGRGGIHFVDHPAGKLVKRLYRRGGMLGRNRVYTFKDCRRAEHEFHVHQTCFDAGLPTSRPVGWVAEAKGSGLHITYFSESLEKARPLNEALVDTKELPSDLCDQIAAILTGLYQLGIEHTDLNLKNWLLAEQRLYIIDFDRARTFSEREITKKDYLIRALKRMARSALKLGVMPNAETRQKLIQVCSRHMSLDAAPIKSALAQIPTKAGLLQQIRWKISGSGRVPGQE